MISRRVRGNLTRLAEKASIDVFSDNLKNLLLTPPCNGKIILGIDPGIFKMSMEYLIFLQNLQSLNWYKKKPSKATPLTTLLTIGYRNGCKLAVIDRGGKVLETGVIYPTLRSAKTNEARDLSTLTKIICNHKVELVREKKVNLVVTQI